VDSARWPRHEAIGLAILAAASAAYPLALAAFGSLVLMTCPIWDKRDFFAGHMAARSALILAAFIRDHLKLHDCSTALLRLHSNRRRLESFNGLGSSSRRSGGNYRATFLRRSFEEYDCDGVWLYLHSCDCQEISGSDCIGCRLCRSGGALYAFDQEWLLYESTPLFNVTPVCAAAILLNRELFLAGRLRFYGLFAPLLLVPVGLLLPRYAAGLA